MNWVERFFAFFREIEPTLAVVLNASGCREGWVQGEFFHRFRTAANGFVVNRPYWDDGVPHDLYALLPTEMVAELKVYGQKGYAPKNLCGAKAAVRSFAPAADGERVSVALTRLRELAEQSEAEKWDGWKNSYFMDVVRLLTAPPEVEKYLILVLHKAARLDTFGRAITAVQVEGAVEHVFDCGTFLVRVSDLTPLGAAPVVNVAVEG